MVRDMIPEPEENISRGIKKFEIVLFKKRKDAEKNCS